MPTYSKKKATAAKSPSPARKPATAEKQDVAVKKKLALMATLRKSLEAKQVRVVRPKASAASSGWTKWDNDFWDPTRWGDFDHRDEEHTVGPTDVIFL